MSFNTVSHVSVRRQRRSRGQRLTAYAVALVAIAALQVVSLVVTGATLRSPLVVVALAALAVVAERQSIPLTPVVTVSISSLVFIFAGVILGPLAAMVVGAAGLLVDLPRRDVPDAVLRWVVWTASRAIIAGSAGVAAWEVRGLNSSSFGVLLGAVVAASAVEAVLDLALMSIPPALRGTSRWRDTVTALGPLQLGAIPLHAPVIAVLSFAYSEVSPWSVALFIMPALAAQKLFLLYRQQRATAEELSAANALLEKASLSLATALVATLDARDRYTAGHSEAVAIYARDIARRMGLPEDQQQLAHLCGLVHDIGKVGLPPGLLEKRGPLTLEERRLMEEHPAIGERILASVDDYAEIASVVRHHHERVDGCGYPDRLRADAIPLLSRIIAVADAYNAMTSDRPYRDAMPSRVARLRLAQAVDAQFDTSVVASFEAILASADDDYRAATADEFGLIRLKRVDGPSALRGVA